MKNQYVNNIIKHLEKCSDIDLLDFILKLLINES